MCRTPSGGPETDDSGSPSHAKHAAPLKGRKKKKKKGLPLSLFLPPVCSASCVSRWRKDSRLAGRREDDRGTRGSGRTPVRRTTFFPSFLRFLGCSFQREDVVARDRQLPRPLDFGRNVRSTSHGYHNVLSRARLLLRRHQRNHTKKKKKKFLQISMPAHRPAQHAPPLLATSTSLMETRYRDVKVTFSVYLDTLEGKARPRLKERKKRTYYTRRED